MGQLRSLSLIVAFCLLAACGGGGFTPMVGPLYGVFTVDGEDIGTFTITTGGGLMGGPGTLVHNAQAVTITVSAVIEDRQITGTVANASLGSGPFLGNFIDTGAATGTFSYTDNGNVSTTTGTWQLRPPQNP